MRCGRRGGAWLRELLGAAVAVAAVPAWALCLPPQPAAGSGSDGAWGLPLPLPDGRAALAADAALLVVAAAVAFHGLHRAALGLLGRPLRPRLPRHRVEWLACALIAHAALPAAVRPVVASPAPGGGGVGGGMPWRCVVCLAAWQLLAARVIDAVSPW